MTTARRHLTRGSGTVDTFAASSDVERWIESFGVEYELFDGVPLDVIDKQASLRNQARRNPLNRDVAMVYAQAMKAGAIFPPVVGYFNGASIILVDGNHRFAGAESAGAEVIAVYVLDLNSGAPSINDMVASANATLNGLGATDEERIRHAISRVDGGMSVTNAARMCGVKDSTLKNNLDAERVVRHSERFGLGRQARQIPQHYAIALAKQIDRFSSDELRAVLAAADVAKNRSEYRTLVRDAAAASDEDRLAVIASFCDERTAINSPKKTRKPQETKPANVFKMHAAAIVKETPAAILATCPPDQVDGLKKLAEELRFIASRIVAP
jgi:hypothetical protein